MGELDANIYRVMSGHSKWSTIKRAKGAADIKRGQTFTKIANAISIAARLGNSGDPNSNPRLRMELEGAKKVNMPKENVQRAVDRGMGNLPGHTLEEVIYEGFGPGKVAFYLEGVTDNKLRTNQEIRNLFEKSGGTLGGSGSTSYMFDKKGELKIKGKGSSEDDEELELIDLGVEDIDSFQEDGLRMYLVYMESPELNTMGTKITQAGFKVIESKIIHQPNIITEIKDPDMAKRVMDFTEKLEEHDDIQKVYANFEIPEELL